MRLDLIVLGTLLTGCAGSTTSVVPLPTDTRPTADTPTGDTGTPAPTCSASVQLGTGIDAFEPLSAGDPLVMVFGPQGGYHLPLAVRACDLGKVARTVVVATPVGGTERVVDVTLDHLWWPESECCGVLLDLHGFLFLDSDPDWSPPVLDGTRVHVAIEVDDGGTLHHDEVEVVVQAPPPEE
ncbi:MAG: hypothetical protein KTR31_24150 [Myxococcales bacterium]|nr:hypothetical protein [Myxococcales bacterium]